MNTNTNTCKLVIVLTLALAIGGVAPATAEDAPVTIRTFDGDGADTFVQEYTTYRTINSGVDQNITLTLSGTSYTRNALLRFDLAAWTNQYSTLGRIATAKLRVYYYNVNGGTGIGGTSTGTVSVLVNGVLQEGRPGPLATDGWNEVTNTVYGEAGVTWNNQPVGTYITVGEFYYESKAYGWYEFSSDELAEFLRADTNGVVTIRIGKKGTAYNDFFYTKEYSAGSKAPELILTPRPKPAGVTLSTSAGHGADAFLDGYSLRRMNNYGAQESMYSSSYPGYEGHLVLRFDLAAIGLGAGNRLGAASLRAYYHACSSPGLITNTISVYGLQDGSDQEGLPGPLAADGWNEITNAVNAEAGITWNNQPTGAYTLLGSFAVTNSTFGWHTFSSDQLLPFLNKDSNGLVTIKLISDNRDRDYFYSREAASGWYAPQLYVEPWVPTGTILTIR